MQLLQKDLKPGGHNGFEETTTMALIPQIINAVSIPVIAAGGIGSGRSMLAAMALGADGVQIGSRFAASQESSAHDNFKQAIVDANDGSTQLTLKKLVPVRLIKNEFFNQVQEAENQGATSEQLKEILGRARAKKGMFEGDLREGELEVGQVSGYINEIKSASEIIVEIIDEFNKIQSELSTIKF